MNSVVTRMLIAISVGYLVVGCAAVPPEAAIPAYQNRAVTRDEAGIEVSTAVLSSEESAAVYGVPLAERRIQPVWIEVRNREDHNYFLLSPGLIQTSFPHRRRQRLSAAMLRPTSVPSSRAASVVCHNPVRPGDGRGVCADEFQRGREAGATGSRRERTRSDVLRFVSVPGFEADYKRSQVFRRATDPQEPTVNYTDDASFREALEALPCCATDEDGSKKGDPLNLVIVGSLDDAFPALVRRGWSLTERKWSGAIERMISAALSGQAYVNAPVSDLYLFGRAQDLALQKARGDIHQRNHMRLWLSTMRYHDKPVWVGQISRDIGIRLTWHSSTFTTHKIDPEVDEARTALTEDMAYSQNLFKMGLVTGVGAVLEAAPRRNLTTDPYYTDGFRVVLVFDRTPRPLSQIEIFPWITPYKVLRVTPGARP